MSTGSASSPVSLSATVLTMNTICTRHLLVMVPGMCGGCGRSRRMKTSDVVKVAAVVSPAVATVVVGRWMGVPWRDVPFLPLTLPAALLLRAWGNYCDRKDGW